MQKASQQLNDMVRSCTNPLGYELVGVEMMSRNKGGHLLRIYIDKEGGVTAEDCQQVSHQVSGVLDVEDPIQGEYALEVSSPGLDRPLFELKHFSQFVGEVVRVKLHAAISGRRNYKGKIVAIEGDEVQLEVDGETVVIPFASLDSARLVPVF